MNGATLKTLREALCLPVKWLANVAGVQERTVRYWESGHMPVPADVDAQMRQLEAVAASLVNQGVEAIRAQIAAHGLPGEPVRLVRYVEDEDIARYLPELTGVPATYHAAVLARIRWSIEADDVEVEMHALDVAAYSAWLKSTKQVDSTAMRAQFVALE